MAPPATMVSTAASARSGAVLPSTTYFDPDRPGPLEENAGDGRARQRGPVRPIASRPEIGDRGAASPAVMGRRLMEARALLRRAIEIRIERNACLLRRLDERSGDLDRADRIRDRKGPVDSVIWPREPLVTLGLAKIGQHVLVRPAGVAERGPGIIVLRLAAGIDHRVDGASAAKRAALRIPQLAIVEVLLGNGPITPIDSWAGELREAGGDVNIGMRVRVLR